MKKLFTKSVIYSSVITSVFIFTAVSIFAQPFEGDYRFKANTTGNWNDVANWEVAGPGVTGWNDNANFSAASSIPNSSTINVRIPGSSNTSVDVSVDCAQLTIFGAMTVNSGITLGINASSQFFQNNQTITVSGTLSVRGGNNLILGNTSTNTLSVFNNGTIEFPTGGSTFTVKSFVTLTNNAAITKNGGGGVTVESGAFFINDGTFTKTGGGTPTYAFAGTYSGTGTFTGYNFDNTGTVSPGASPGCQVYGNDYTNTGTLNIEINGTTACTQFDQLQVTGTATAGGTLNVTFGVTPTVNQTFQIIDATGGYAGSFATINVNPAHTATYSNGVLTVTAVLPIELLSFTAKPMTSSVMLNWQTATELNNDHMAIERSADGKNFTEIGRVAGAGTTYEEQAYELEDRSPLKGMNYYRLRQVDYDGTTTFSHVVSAAFQTDGRPGELNVYPTTLKNGETLNVDFGEMNEEIELHIFNTNGQLMLSQNVFAEGQISFPINKFSDGMYILKTNGLNQNLTGRFFVKN